MDTEIIRILGVPVSVTYMERTVAVICKWIEGRQSRYVCVRDVHGIMLAQKNHKFREIHEKAGMVVPDGMPLVWVSWVRGKRQVARVAGADLVTAVCEYSQSAGFRHFLYGGKEGVAERMAAKLKSAYPHLEIVGYLSPPFGDLTPAEDNELVQNILVSRPHIIWVGLSTPKQEIWMHDHVGRFSGATLIGVGAAFDFYAGDIRRAPKWMQKSGLEWAHRLYSEPRRLWRRYLFLAPLFIFKVFAEQIKLKNGPT